MKKLIILISLVFIFFGVGGFFYYQETKPDRLFKKSIKEYQNSNYTTAINTITQAINLVEKNDFFSARCEYKIKNKSFSGAISDCKIAYENKDTIKNSLFSIEENYTKVIEQNIQDLYENGKYLNALEENKVLQNIKENIDFIVYECSSYIKLFDVENAKTKCSYAYESKDKIKSPQIKNMLFVNYSNLLLEEEKLEEANKIIQEGKNFDKDNLELYIQEGYYLNGKEEYQKSIDSFLKGLNAKNVTDNEKLKIYTSISNNYHFLENDEQNKIYLKKAENIDKENIYFLLSKGNDTSDGALNIDTKLGYLLKAYNKINLENKFIFQSQKTQKIDLLENILFAYWLKGNYNLALKYSQELVDFDVNNKMGNFVLNLIKYINSKSEKEYNYILKKIEGILGLEVTSGEIILMDVYVQGLNGVNTSIDGYEKEIYKNYIKISDKLKKQNESIVSERVYEEIKMFFISVLYGFGEVSEKELQNNYQNILKTYPDYDYESNINYRTEKFGGVVENIGVLYD